MCRSKHKKDFFVGFDFNSDTLCEIDRFFKADQAVTIPHPVREILHEQIARKLV